MHASGGRGEHLHNADAEQHHCLLCEIRGFERRRPDLRRTWRPDLRRAARGARTAFAGLGCPRRKRHRIIRDRGQYRRPWRLCRRDPASDAGRKAPCLRRWTRRKLPGHPFAVHASRRFQRGCRCRSPQQHLLHVSGRSRWRCHGHPSERHFFV